MPVWQWLLDSAGVVLLVILLFGLLLVVRRRVLSRHGGTFELSVRDPEQAPTDAAGCSAWVATARTPSSWYRIFSPLPVPRRSWRRNDLALVSQRRPEASEEYALYAGHVVVVCSTPRGEVELAMSPSSLTGLQSWLEAGPPGSRPSRESLVGGRTYGGCRSPRSPPGHPEHVAVLAVRVAGQDEEQVGEPVQVGDRQHVHRVGVLARSAAQAERSARRQTVRATCRWAAASVPPLRMNERSLGRSSLYVVAPALEPVDVVGLDPQRRVLRVLHHRRAEVGADVEEVVLHVGQHRGHVLVEATGGQDEAEVGVGLVDVGVGLEPEVGLAGLAHVAQAGAAAVAGTRVDAGQVRPWPTLASGREGPLGSSHGQLPRGLRGAHDPARSPGWCTWAARRTRPQADGGLAARAGTLGDPQRANILDVAVMGQLLRALGCEVVIAYPGDADPTASRPRGAPRSTCRRSWAQGPLRARTPAARLDRRAGSAGRAVRRASVALPGGDAIGSRGLDMHIRGLQELGAVVRIEHGQVVAEVPDGLTGANLWLDFPSVGATENL